MRRNNSVEMGSHSRRRSKTGGRRGRRWKASHLVVVVVLAFFLLYDNQDVLILRCLEHDRIGSGGSREVPTSSGLKQSPSGRGKKKIEDQFGFPPSVFFRPFFPRAPRTSSEEGRRISLRTRWLTVGLEESYESNPKPNRRDSASLLSSSRSCSCSINLFELL